jgi:hypothetical protein
MLDSMRAPFAVGAWIAPDGAWVGRGADALA